VAALDRGAVREIVEDGITGGIFSSLDDLIAGLPAVTALERARVRDRAVARFGLARMIDAYVAAYSRLAGGGRGRDFRGWDPHGPADRALISGTGL